MIAEGFRSAVHSQLDLHPLHITETKARWQNRPERTTSSRAKSYITTSKSHLSVYFELFSFHMQAM